jgi:hypothetical protein
VRVKVAREPLVKVKMRSGGEPPGERVPYVLCVPPVADGDPELVAAKRRENVR